MEKGDKVVDDEDGRTGIILAVRKFDEDDLNSETIVEVLWDETKLEGLQWFSKLTPVETRVVQQLCS